MGVNVLTQPIRFNRKEIESSFRQLDAASDYMAEKIVYYPYYYFIYNVKAKRVFLPMDEKVGCTVDALGGKGALTDADPELKSKIIEEKEMLKQSHSIQACLSISESFVYRSLSLKMRMVSFSNVKMEKKEFFYRPYWVVINKNEQQGHHFIVDAVSGRYHPLS
ncbi:hypothetical protein [Virgibacillus kimchii]